MRKMIISLAFTMLAGWIDKSTKDEKLRAMFLFLVNALTKTTEVLTDDDKDNSAQLEKLASEELPDVVEIALSFITERKNSDV